MLQDVVARWASRTLRRAGCPRPCWFYIVDTLGVFVEVHTRKLSMSCSVSALLPGTFVQYLDYLDNLDNTTKYRHIRGNGPRSH